MQLIKEIGLGYATNNALYRCQLAIYKCPDCLTEVELSVCKVKKQKPKRCRSCHIASMTKHGEAKDRSRLYGVWCSMMDRCRNKNHKAYSRYGGRGIQVCSDWANYIIFAEWAKINGYSIGLSLDRRDNDKGYFADNCRWTTHSVQGRNTVLLNAANTSGFRGIFKAGLRWRAAIRINTKRVYLGYWNTKEEAAKAYDNYVITHDLQSPLNFPTL